MKKIYKNIGLLFACGTLLFTACSDDDNTGYSQVNYVAPTVTLSSSENNVTVSENTIEDLYEITVTASITEAVEADIIIPIVQTGGTATADDDYHVGTITLSAGSTSASTTVEIYQTGDIEGDETLTLEPASNISNANVGSFALNVTINDDYINNEINFTMDWSGSSTVDLTEDGSSFVNLDYCNIDFDLALWNDSDLLGYIAATADCPEEGGFSGLPDGTYYLVAELYDNPFYDLGITDPLEVRISYSQEFFASGSFASTVFTLADTPKSELLATITIEDGYNYTVTPE